MIDDTSIIPRWLDGDDPDNPFNVAGYDCLAYVTTMISATSDQGIARSFLLLRDSLGAEYKDNLPEDAVELACDLRYGYTGEVGDGPLYKSSQMEEKWDIYLYGDRHYFCRSWTGELCFVAGFSKTESEMVISRIWAERGRAQTSDRFAIQAVDYLIKNHLFKRRVPHPLPENLPRDPETVGAYSFSQYGNMCCFATWEDTITAGLKSRELA